MTVSAISGAGNTTSTDAASSTSNTKSNAYDLGEDAFLTLLLAQLENQDPLNPMEDADFIAQLAQFQSLSELTNIGDSLEDMMASQKLAQGSNLIGHTVSGQLVSGKVVTGVVQGLYMTDGDVVLDVDGTALPLDSVTYIQATETETEA